MTHPMLNISEEQLNLALEFYAVLSEEELDSKRFRRAVQEAGLTITKYILQQFAQQGKHEFTEEEVGEQFGVLIAQKVLDNMSHDGLLEAQINEDGEEMFSLTDLGKQLHDALKDR